jgi:hypothetical protein
LTVIELITIILLIEIKVYRFNWWSAVGKETLREPNNSTFKAYIYNNNAAFFITARSNKLFTLHFLLAAPTRIQNGIVCEFLIAKGVILSGQIDVV